MISRWHLAAILVLIGIILVPITVLAVVTCPYGIVNDPYPGKCQRYTDTDQNGICDISETDPGPGPLTMVPATVPVSPVSSPPGSGSGQQIQTGDDDREDEAGEVEDDEESPNRDRNRTSQSSRGSQVSGSANPASEVPVTGPASVPSVTPKPPSAAATCPYGIVNDPYPGECRRYIDANGDGFCDLSVPEAVLTVASTIPVTPSETLMNQTCSSTAVPSSVSCPYRIVNDPYPGKCPAYLDANNDTLCDLSQELSCGKIVLPATACPFGKVNDPYPGACAKYVDMNINGLCDYSENETHGETRTTDTGGGSGSVPPTGLLAAGMGAGCIVIGYSFGRGKK